MLQRTVHSQKYKNQLILKNVLINMKQCDNFEDTFRVLKKKKKKNQKIEKIKAKLITGC